MSNRNGRYRILAVFLLVSLVFVLFAGCAGRRMEVENILSGGMTDPTEPPEMSVPDLAEYVQERTVTVHAAGSGTGSGFFIDNTGTVVTNYHVIEGATGIEVETDDGRIFPMVHIIDYSEDYDLAVIWVDYPGAPYLNIAADPVRTGENVYAVGSSLGFLSGTFSSGIVSTDSRDIGIIDCIQTTAAISAGNSGGPLVNSRGQVVGINAFSYDDGENLNFAIKISYLDILAMDKYWSIGDFVEWYQQMRTNRYYVYSYSARDMLRSDIYTYQYITGADCWMSAWEWDLEDTVDGYDEEYSIFFYDYDADEVEQYMDYLEGIGFRFSHEQGYNDGTSYFYVDDENSYTADIYVYSDHTSVAIEITHDRPAD